MTKPLLGESLPALHVATFVLTLVMGLAPVCHVAAVDSTWNASVSDGVWNTAANWSDGQIPIAAGDVARFPTPPGATITASLPAEVVLGTLIFENSVRSVTVQGPAALAFDNLSSDASEIHFSTATSIASNTISASIRIADSDGLAVDIGEGKTLLLGGGIASSSGGDLIKHGVGSLHLTGNSGAWSGRLVVDAGLLRVEGEASVGASSGGILVNPGGTLVLYRNTALQNEPIELAGGLLRAEGQSLNPSMLGPMLLSADSRIQSSGFFEIKGNVSGPAGVRFSGQTTIIRGDNSYAGVTTIGAGRVDVHTAAGLGTALQGTILEPSGALNLYAATAEPILLRGGTLNFQTATSAAGPLTLQSGLITLSNASDFAATIKLEQSDADAVISGNGRLLSGGIVGSGNLKLLGNLIVNGAPISHNGDLIIQNADSHFIRLQTPNSFTGNLVVRSGNVAIEHQGANLRPTIVEGGQLRIERNDIEYSPEIRLARGVVSNLGEVSGPVILDNAQGTRRLSGGTFSGVISGTADVTFEGREGNDQTISGHNSFDAIAWTSYGVVNANSSSAFGTTNWATVVTNGILNVNQPTGEQFYVAGSGLLNVNAPIERAPHFLVQPSPGYNIPRVAINAPSTFGDDLAVSQGWLEVNASLSARSLIVRNSGRVTVAGGASFGLVGGEIELREGRIEGKFTNAPVLRKTTYFGAELGAMPQFNGDIVVEHGLLEVYPGAFGTTAGVTRVRNDGQLMLRGVGTIADDIFLENAKGPLNRGGLFVGGVCCGATTTEITGHLHLGDKGSILGAGGNGRDGILRFHSPIEGGDLTTWGSGISVQLLNDNLYTGVTDIRQGYVELMGNGRLSLTSAIILHESDGPWDGTLLLDNESLGGGVDRVDASVPIEFRGGTISAFGGGSEHFGTLRFVEGHSDIDARTMAISAGRIERTPGATLFAEMGSMPVTEVPSNYNGVIPWMQVRPQSTGGPTYDVFGEVVNGEIRALNRATIVTDINSATSSSNVGVSGGGRPVLTADRTINSLLVARDGIVDLAGHTLTIESGGISAWGGTIRNGNLTAGAARELIVHYGASVDANIVDGPDGPLDVTVSESTIGGDNSFTGRLVVNPYSAVGAAQFVNENALPDGIDVALFGGHLETAYVPTRTKNLREVIIKGGGRFTGSGAFSFDSLLLEHGAIGVGKLSGDGPVRKTTIGSASIGVADRTDTSYTGQIDVDEGLLNVVGLPAATFVVNGGRLQLSVAANSIHLNGGELEFYRLSSPVEVSAPSTMIPIPQSSSPALTGPLTGSGKLTFNSTIQYLNYDIDAPARLNIGRDNPDFSGDVDIRLAEISVGRPQALGTGAITVFADGQLNLGGSSSNPFSVANRITLDGGQLRGGSQSRHTGELHVTSPSYVGGLELAGSLYFTNGVPLTTIGSEATRFRGQMHVGADAQLVLGRYEGSSRGVVEIGGRIIADESASVIDIRRGGLDELQFTASLHAPSSRSLEVRLDGQTMPLSLGVGQTISGGGSIRNSINLGLGSIVSPGNLGTETGKLSVVGDVTIETGARVQVEIGGLDSDEYDQIDVSGKVSLGGELNLEILNLGDGFYLPTVGDSFTILNSTEDFTGMFTNSEMLTSVAGGSIISWALESESHQLVLCANSITPTVDGDFNGNGIVDSADYTVWRNTLGGRILAADGNRDGKIDGLDYAIWKSNFGEATLGAGSVDAYANVPEPSTLLSSSFALILIFWPRMWLQRRCLSSQESK